MDIRTERPEDRAAIRDLLTGAFESAAEADLVDRLRADGDTVFSLVADEGGVVAGCAMLSRMRAPFRALGLAPVAVREEYRRRGIAERLIREALRCARDDAWDAVFVLGDPAYYGRFGFRAETAAGFDCAYTGPYLMALSLDGLPLPAASGPVEYAPAFAPLG